MIIAPPSGGEQNPAYCLLRFFLFTQAVLKCPSAALYSSCVIVAYEKYASFLMTSRALHPNIFEPPVNVVFKRRVEFFLNAVVKLSFRASRVSGGTRVRSTITCGHDKAWPSMIAFGVCPKRSRDDIGLKQ